MLKELAPLYSHQKIKIKLEAKCKPEVKKVIPEITFSRSEGMKRLKIKPVNGPIIKRGNSWYNIIILPLTNRLGMNFHLIQLRQLGYWI